MKLIVKLPEYTISCNVKAVFLNGYWIDKDSITIVGGSEGYDVKCDGFCKTMFEDLYSITFTRDDHVDIE